MSFASAAPRARDRPPFRACLVGFGEVGWLLAEAAAGHASATELTVTFVGHTPSSSSVDRVRKAGLPLVSFEEHIPSVDLVASAVTPASATEVARRLAPRLQAGATYLDLNSVGAEEVASIDEAVRASDAHLAKAAILGPVPLLGIRTPMVVGGPGSAVAGRWLHSLGFVDLAALDDPTTPAQVKLLWSVVSKGMTALYAEALLGAKQLGLLEPLLQVMRNQGGFLGSDPMVVRLLLSNVLAGGRRIGEIAAAERTLLEVGITPRSTAATRDWLRRLMELGPRLRTDFEPGTEPTTAVATVEWLAHALLDHEIATADRASSSTLEGGDALGGP